MQWITHTNGFLVDLIRVILPPMEQAIEGGQEEFRDRERPLILAEALVWRELGFIRTKGILKDYQERPLIRRVSADYVDFGQSSISTNGRVMQERPPRSASPILACALRT